ncbi:Bacterial Ig-like domain (group 3) [uncultured archaeon]|nr:Bacterial Ig-like domain (group 3) [uncultured archaeon]
MKTWQRIAMFMIYLMISLPFVFAQELSVQKFQGKDNARGFAKAHDELTIEVLAKIPGEDVIDKEQLRLYLEDMYTTFDSCNATGSGYHTCTIYEPEFSSYQPLNFRIEMRDDAENMVGQQDETLNIDNQAPVIKEMNVEPSISNGEVTISYAAEDYALTYGDTSTCSGLKTITVKSGTTVLATDSAALGECTKDNARKINFDTAGTKQVCVTALDYVNFASTPRCQEVKIDKAAPTIEEVNILDQNGFILTHVHSGEERTATVNAVITDDIEVDPETVRANFEQLNPNLPDFAAPDTNQNDIYTWQNIPVSEVSPCKITVTAKDTLGNENTQDFGCSIKADDTPPTFKQAVSESTRDGLPLYGYNTELKIDFEDKDNTGAPGIGLQSGNVYLDLSALGMDSAAQPDVCSKMSGADWQCSWLLLPPPTVPEGNYSITLKGSDDLGNELAEQAFDIVYDNTGPAQPQIIEAKVVTGEAGVTYTGGAVRGDYVQYKVRSSEFETAFANFSDIGGGDKEPATICEPSTGAAKDCTFESLVILDGPFTANLAFTFYDDAMNKASTTAKLEIYGMENATTANYWNKPSVTCSPRVIDRKTASIMPTIATCRLDLTTPNPKVSTLAIAGPTAPDQCTGDIDLNVNDIYLINTAEGSKSPYLFIVLEPKEYLRNTLNISCPITIYSKREETVGGVKRYYVSPIPQTVETNVTLQFYNSPLGLPDAAIDAKINRSIDTAWNNMKWLSDLRKYMYYAEMACWIKGMIVNALATMYLLVSVITAISSGAKLFAYTKSAGDAAEQTAANLCTEEEKLAEKALGPETAGPIIQLLNTLCGIVNCASTGEGALYEGYIGGAVPWCKDPSKFFGAEGMKMERAQEYLKYAEKETGGVMPNIKDSLILSIGCLCLPGIIYNLEKLHQINCFKTVCLYDYVKQQGYPIDFCEEMHDYFVCAYVVGEVFAIIPFAAFFDKMMDMVTTFLSDYWAWFSVILGGLCESLCKAEGQAVNAPLIAFIGCALLKTLSTTMESTAAIKKMSDSKSEFGKPPGSQYCDRVEDIKKEMKK